jgi:competence protein CoiA
MKKERDAREKIYKNMVWVVNCSRLKNDHKRFNKNKNLLIPKIGQKYICIVEPHYIEKLFPSAWINCNTPILFDFDGKIEDDQNNFLYCLLPKNDWYYEVAKITYKSFINSTTNGSWISRVENYIKINIESRKTHLRVNDKRNINLARRKSEWIIERGVWKKLKRF